MLARNRTAILLSMVLLGAPRSASASENLLISLTDRELAAEAAGQSLVIASRMGADTPPSGLVGGGMARDFFGVETISTSKGTGSLAEAATTLAVRASLREGTSPRAPF